MTTSIKPPTWFWIASILALAWNLMGVMAYLTHVTMTPEAFQKLPEAERVLMESVPAWATAAFAVAVWGGALGSLFLLLRKRLATLVLLVSFMGIVIQMVHSIFISNSIEVYGPGGMIMPVMVIIIGVLLIFFSRRATANGWIR